MSEEIDNELERVQVHIDQVKEAIELADKLQKLEDNLEFQELVLDRYLKGEPARLASIITDPSMLNDTDQREILGAIKAVGYFGDYCRNIIRRGVQMKRMLAEAEEYQNTLRSAPFTEEDDYE
jgi:hypothetical protein